MMVERMLSSIATKAQEKYVKVLVVEDERAIRRLLETSFAPTEFKLLEAATGEEGKQMIAKDNPDIVILDLGLPDIDGIDLVRNVREWSQVPIIVLSARLSETQKVAALEAGADDYVTKPFGVAELIARLRVAYKHAESQKGTIETPVFESGELKVDVSARQVFVADKQVRLTPIEYKLLITLVRHAGKVVTHRQLLSDVWGPGFSEETQYVRVYMGHLRRKIETDPVVPRYLLTEPGVGYRLAV